MSSPLVSIITATTGREQLINCVKSVKAQTYKNIQHIVVPDGPDPEAKIIEMVMNHPEGRVLQYSNAELAYVMMPYSIGKDRYNGHRIYGAMTYVAEGEYFIYLDDDNTLSPTHVEDCLRVIQEGSTWSFSFRNIVSTSGEFLCKDDCESLGIYPSVIHPQDYFLDVNCYFLPKMIAVAMSPVWHCKFRESGQPEIDRKMMAFLRHHFPNYDGTYKYTVNYAVGGSALSVAPDFFVQGNAEMLRRYNGNLPWKKI